LPVIGIGNLSAGGTGKTPTAEYVLKLLLENGYSPALLSRGYGRKTRGFLEVMTDSSSVKVGDEPYQVKRKFPDVYVTVCEDRVVGVENIMYLKPETDVIVLDDSFQHRKIKPGFNILLTDYNHPYYNDLLLPAGMLREPISGRKRANVILVTKCPEDIDDQAKVKIKTKLKVSKNQKAYFTSIAYQPLQNAFNEDIMPLNELTKFKALLFTGIANTAPLEQFLHQKNIDFKIIKYPDHHQFSKTEAENIISEWKNVPGNDKILLTTEKDWRRMEGTEQAGLYAGLPLYFLPIAMQGNPTEMLIFDKTLIEYVQRNSAGS